MLNLCRLCYLIFARFCSKLIAKIYDFVGDCVLVIWHRASKVKFPVCHLPHRLQSSKHLLVIWTHQLRCHWFTVVTMTTASSTRCEEKLFCFIEKYNLSLRSVVLTFCVSKSVIKMVNQRLGNCAFRFGLPSVILWPPSIVKLQNIFHLTTKYLEYIAWHFPCFIILLQLN